MNLDGLNKWLTLIANIGVFAGILFVAFEVMQSNRIAFRESQVDLYGLNTALFNSAASPAELEVRVKLREPDPELTPYEQELAQGLATQMVNLWLVADSAFSAGQLNELRRDGWIGAARSHVDYYPGLARHLLISYAGQAGVPEFYLVTQAGLDAAREQLGDIE